MPLYEKTTTTVVTVDADDASKSLVLYQTASGNRGILNLPGLPQIDLPLATLLPLGADRLALKSLVDKMTANALAAHGAVVKP